MYNLYIEIGISKPRNSSLLGKKNTLHSAQRDILSKKNRPRYSIKLPSFNYATII